MLFLPISAAILIVFVAGICYLFASINVFLRDFGFIWTSVSILWFFCSPIFFPLSQLTPAHRKYFELNPFLPFLQLFQDPISKGVLPSVEAIAISTVYAVVLLFVGSTVFARSQKSFYAYL
jgi:ABC-type polysaccharide/polyol phosphate export permease